MKTTETIYPVVAAQITYESPEGRERAIRRVCEELCFNMESEEESEYAATTKIATMPEPEPASQK